MKIHNVAEQIKPSQQNECPFYFKFVMFSVITSSPLPRSKIRFTGAFGDLSEFTAAPIKVAIMNERLIKSWEKVEMD